MAKGGAKGVDVEMGNGQLYPNMAEDPQMRWAFIRKVYTIVCIQFMITVGVSIFMFLTPAVKGFLSSMPYGLVTVISVAIFTIAIMCTVTCWSQIHPWNYLLMLIFTLGMSFLIGCGCAYKRGEIVVMAAGLTALVTFSLTLYTFWAAKRGKDFGFLGPFLLCASIIFLAFGILRMFFPMGGRMNLIYGCLGSLLFSVFIIYDTDNLIKRFDYDEYFQAAACLYLDILNLFSSLLTVLNELM